MQRFWEIAPPTTWGLLILASSCMLAAFVLLSHGLLRKKACGDRWEGSTTPGRLAWSVRTGVALLLVGAALWSLTLGAPWWIAAGLGLVALVAMKS